MTKTSTASDEDIFRSSGVEDSESFEEMNNSDESEEAAPWGALGSLRLVCFLTTPTP